MQKYRYLLLIVMILIGNVAAAQAQGTLPPNGVKPFIMPVAEPSGPSTWILGQPYGNTTGAYVSGASQYSAGQYLHFGIDISMPCGTPVIAVADGFVDSVDNPYRGSAPHNLSLSFPELGLSVLYGHLLVRPVLVEGQAVTQGQVVGLSGDPDSDCDSRPHLHFEVRSQDQRVAYNAINFIEAPWHSLIGIDSRARSPFQRDLTNPRRWVTLEDQPDVQFGGRRLNDYAQTWPTGDQRRVPISTLPDRPYTPIRQDWGLRQIGSSGCCAGAWWDPTGSNRLFFIDGIAGQLAFIHEMRLDDQPTLTTSQNAPPPTLSADGSYQLIYAPDKTTVRRLSDGAEWYLAVPDNYPVLSPDNAILLWTQGTSGTRQVWVAALDGSLNKTIWTSQGRNTSARWLDSDHVLMSEREPTPGRYTTLSVVNVHDSSVYTLGTWHNLRNLQIAPGGQRIIFFSAFNPDPANDGAFALEIEPGVTPEKLPWFGDYRWRDAESVYYITFDPTTDIQRLNFYHVPTGDNVALTDSVLQAVTALSGIIAIFGRLSATTRIV